MLPSQLLIQTLWICMSTGLLFLWDPLWWLNFPCLDNPSSLSSTGFPKLIPVPGCGSQDLLLSVTQWWLSDDKWGSHLSDYSRQQVQATYSLLLGVLAGVMLVHLSEVPLYQVSSWLPKAPSRHFLHCSSVKYLPQPNPLFSHPHWLPVYPGDIFYFPFSGNSMYYIPLWAFQEP